MKALILAAGLGSRMKHLTAQCPKPMLPVGDKPLLDHTVGWLRRHNVTELAMNVHHAPHVIMDYFGDGRDFDVDITYSQEETLLGTAGAAKKLESFLDDTFLVVYGDVFTNIDVTRLHEFHVQKRQRSAVDATISLALSRVPNPTECGLVELNGDGQIHRFVEKPPPHEIFTELANSGVLLCDSAILEDIPRSTFFDFSHDLFPLLMRQRRPLFGQQIAENEFVVDIGTVPGYTRAQQIQRTVRHGHVPSYRVRTKARIGR